MYICLSVTFGHSMDSMDSMSKAKCNFLPRSKEADGVVCYKLIFQILCLSYICKIFLPSILYLHLAYNMNSYIFDFYRDYSRSYMYIVSSLLYGLIPLLVIFLR